MNESYPIPRLFIGSSSEGLPIAQAAANALQAIARPTVWTDAGFYPGSLLLEAIENELTKFDFALLVGTPDDELYKRHTSSKIMRDNVLFEFGFFIGILGRKRTYLLIPAIEGFELPSDLGGLLTARYIIEADPATSVAKGCDELTKAIEQEWLRTIEEREQRARDRMNSNKSQSILRLFRLSMALNNIYRPPAHLDPFHSIRETTISEINKISEELRKDAVRAGLEDQFDSVLETARAAAGDLPSADELWDHYNRMREVVVMRFDPFVYHAGKPQSLKEWHNNMRKQIPNEWAESMGILLNYIAHNETGQTRDEIVQEIERLASYTIGARDAVKPLAEIERRYSEWWSAHKNDLVSQLDGFHKTLLNKLAMQIDPSLPNDTLNEAAHPGQSDINSQLLGETLSLPNDTLNEAAHPGQSDINLQLLGETLSSPAPRDVTKPWWRRLRPGWIP